MGRTILSFVAGAASAAAVIYTIGPPPPARWIGSSGPEDAIETEAFDPAWAPATEQQLDRFLQGRLALAGIRCRTVP